MIGNKIVGAVIPTRYNSERLPGKVLIDICGKPNIEWMIERIFASEIVDIIVLAVSEKIEESYNISNWYNIYHKTNKGKKVFLTFGPHDDLMTRTIQCIEKYQIDLVVMLSHDCTLVCPFIIDTLISRLIEYKADYSSNVITRTFPDGFDVQVFTQKIYKKINQVIPKDHPTRIWTGWNIFHWREELFPKPKIINLEAPKCLYYPDWRICLDTPEDKKVIEYILKYFKEHNYIYYTYWGIINYLIKHPKIMKLNSKIIPTKLLRKDET